MQFAFTEDQLLFRDTVRDLLANECKPEDVRDIVVLRYFDELELEEIAERQGINERTVRRKLEAFLEGARKILGRL